MFCCCRKCPSLASAACRRSSPPSLLVVRSPAAPSTPSPPPPKLSLQRPRKRFRSAISTGAVPPLPLKLLCLCTSNPERTLNGPPARSCPASCLAALNPSPQRSLAPPLVRTPLIRIFLEEKKKAHSILLFPIFRTLHPLSPLSASPSPFCLFLCKHRNRLPPVFALPRLLLRFLLPPPLFACPLLASSSLSFQVAIARPVCSQPLILFPV